MRVEVVRSVCACRSGLKGGLKQAAEHVLALLEGEGKKTRKRTARGGPPHKKAR